MRPAHRARTISRVAESRAALTPEFPKAARGGGVARRLRRRSASYGAVSRAECPKWRRSSRRAAGCAAVSRQPSEIQELWMRPAHRARTISRVAESRAVLTPEFPKHTPREHTPRENTPRAHTARAHRAPPPCAPTEAATYAMPSGFFTARAAAPRMPALLRSLAGTIGVVSFSSGRNCSWLFETPPPTMKRSGEKRNSTAE